jgi:hypothetical protein
VSGAIEHLPDREGARRGTAVQGYAAARVMSIRRGTLVCIALAVVGCRERPAPTPGPAATSVEPPTRVGRDAGPLPDGGDAEATKPIERLARLRGSPRFIVSDPERLYWTECDFEVIGSCKTGTVRVMPKRGKPDSASTLASGQKDPWNIALDAEHVYWTNLGDDSVWRVAKVGGEPKRLGAVPGDIVELALDDTRLFVLDRYEQPQRSRVLSMPKTGGPWREIAHDSGLSYTLVTGRDRVIWGDTRRVMWSAPAQGGERSKVDAARAHDLVVDGNTLIVSAFEHDVSVLRRLPFDGGTPSPIFELSELEQRAIGGRTLGAADNLVVEGEWIYFRLGAGTAVGRALGNRAGRPQWISGLRDVIAFTVDRERIYALLTGAGAGPYLGAVTP